MSSGGPNLLDEVLGINHSCITFDHLVLVEDCAEVSGGFILHHLLKKCLASSSTHGSVVFLALSHPFSHYDRILRKLGCNLSALRDAGRFHFIDMLNLDIKGSTTERGQMELYENIKNAIVAASTFGCIRIMIDDLFLLEIALHGSTNHVLDMLHYCMTSAMDCSVVALNHADIYPDEGPSNLISHLEYRADIIIKTHPLVTGLAADVHGQLTVIDKRRTRDALQKWGSSKLHNFHFKLQENGVDFFYPGKYF